MKILAIESSCDETSAAIVETGSSPQSVKVLSNVTATSMAIHAGTGGIIPENAAREQIKFIIPVIREALLNIDINFDNETIQHLNNAERFKLSNNILKNEIDAIAVTHGPGLIGSLLVGVETAKTLSLLFNKPVIPVHHLLAHLFANFIEPTINHKPSTINHKLSAISYPLIGLIVSGGHTDLLLFESSSKFKWLGGTRDDAAGEALDKIGRLLNLPYPSGPEIERRASLVKDPRSGIKFQSPMINSPDFDFSFSGLKSEATRFISGKSLTNELTNQICHSLQTAIFDVLVKKTVQAAEKYNVQNILTGGGVSANQTLHEYLNYSIARSGLKIKVFTPEKQYSTDNAAMIGAYALINYKPEKWNRVIARPELYFA